MNNNNRSNNTDPKVNVYQCYQSETQNKINCKAQGYNETWKQLA